MGAELINTSSIFQLSLTINAIFAVILNRYTKQRKALFTVFYNKIINTNSTFCIDGNEKILYKFLYSHVDGFKIFIRFFYFCIFLSGVSVLISFYYLVASALVPTEEISTIKLIVYSVLFIIVNPSCFYLFFLLSDNLPDIIDKKLQVSTSDALKTIDSIELMKIHESLQNALFDIQMNAFKSRYNKFIRAIKDGVNITLHPIIYFKRIKRKNEIDTWIKEEDDKLIKAQSNQE